MVLLHGVPKTGYHWRHLVPKLTPHHTVVVPDLRGLGDSARPVSGYDSATMSDDTAELMARLGHETYAVIGEDWGAVIGYQLAARHREHVTALVFAEALFPGFGFEDHTALTPENVSGGMHLWHLGFYFQPDVPEMLIAGHERELITYMIKNERSHPDTATPDAVEEYVTSPETSSTRATTSRRKYPTRWPTWSCRSWRPTTDRRPSAAAQGPDALLRPSGGGADDEADRLLLSKTVPAAVRRAAEGGAGTPGIRGLGHLLPRRSRRWVGPGTTNPATAGHRHGTGTTMASHTRRKLLKGTAVAAAGSVVGSGLGPGFFTAAAQTTPEARRSGKTGATPFLDGAFAPVTEELTTFDLPRRRPHPARPGRPLPPQRPERARRRGRPRAPLDDR